MTPENIKLYENKEKNIETYKLIVELVEYIGYDLNPIGPQNDLMADGSRKDILEFSDEIIVLLNQLKNNL